MSPSLLDLPLFDELKTNFFDELICVFLKLTPSQQLVLANPVASIFCDAAQHQPSRLVEFNST